MSHRSKLAEATRALLLATDMRPEKIAVEADITIPWLMKFKGKDGETTCPSADRLERLYEVLSGKELRF